MNWDQVEGQWHQLTGKLKSHWGKLTDDDLMRVAGKRTEFAGKLQERYGVLKEDAEKQIDGWLAKLLPSEATTAPSSVSSPVSNTDTKSSAEKIGRPS